MADDFPWLYSTIDDGAVDDDNSNDDAGDDDSSSDGDREKLFDYLKESLPDDFKEYMDKELECLLNSDSEFFNGWVFWSRNDDEPERPPTLSDDILEFNKKIREVLYTTLVYWPECTLVQFWAPITTSEGRSFLTIQNQPFALKSDLDKRDTALVIGLLKYRMISKDYKFYMDLDGESSGEEIGLPGRVFIHQHPESTPNVDYYSITEYPQRNNALRCQVGQSLAFPVFERSTQRCIGVLELVTPKDCREGSSLIWNYWEWGIEINKGFEKEGLKCSVAFDHTTMKLDVDKNEARALYEIKEVLRMVCEDHALPFAQAWVMCKVGWPCRALGDGGILGVICQYNRPNDYYIFQMISRNLHLKKGVGVVGTTLLSPNMVFCRDVTQFSLTEYPLAHYARHFELRGCFAICLQSICTGNEFYVLEFFMPMSYQASEIPHTRLSKIWETMRKNLHNFRFASGEELCEELRIDEIDNRGKFDSVHLPQTTTISLPWSEPLQSGGEIMQVDSSYQQLTNGVNNGSNVGGTEHSNIAITCAQEKGTVKASQKIGNKAGVKIKISLEDMLRTSKMKLKDATKHLEVSRSTLKRIRKDYGYERWPPRKINKAGPSQLNESALCVDQQQIPQLNSDHLPFTRASTTIVHTKPHDTTMQDANIVTIKAKYGEDTIIKFRLSLSSRLVELQEQVAKRLSLEVGTYCVKYKDEDGDLILVACDQDLQDCIHDSRLQGSTSIVVLLEPK